MLTGFLQPFSTLADIAGKLKSACFSAIEPVIFYQKLSLKTKR